MTADSRISAGYAPFSDAPHPPTATALVEVASITAAATERDRAAVLPVHPAPRFGRHPMWVGMWRLTGNSSDSPLLLEHDLVPTETAKVVVGIDHANPSLVELLDELAARQLTYTAFTRDKLGPRPAPRGCITKVILDELRYQTSKKQVGGGRYRSFLFGHTDPRLQHEQMTLHGR